MRVLKARILKWFAIPITSGPRFVRTVHHDPSTLGGPTWHAHSFTELDKAVIHVIFFLVFYDCGFLSVCPLIEKDKRFMEAPWLERLTEEGTGSYTRVAQKFSTWWWNDFSMCSNTKTAASFITWIEKCAHMAMYLDFNPRI